MASHPIDYLLNRRSVSVREMQEPAPDAAQLTHILRAATRVPDHGKLTPWRIVVLYAAGQQALGEIAAAQWQALHADASAAELTHERARFQRAPLVIAVISTPVAGSKPVWEQQLSAAAVCMNMLHAAHMLGLGGKWLTEWVAYDPMILSALLARSANPPTTHAGEEDAPNIAGFLYFGSIKTPPEDRARPALADIVADWE